MEMKRPACGDCLAAPSLPTGRRRSVRILKEKQKQVDLFVCANHLWEGEIDYRVKIERKQAMHF
jgi:hypothetical protein